MLQTDDKLCAARSPLQATPTEDCGAGARGVRTSVLQYVVRTTRQKEPKTYCEHRHDDDDDDGAGGDIGDCNGDGDGAGKGVDADVMGGQPTNLGVAILA